MNGDDKMKIAYLIAALAIMALASTAFGECKCESGDMSGVRASAVKAVNEVLDGFKTSRHADSLLSGTYDPQGASAAASAGIKDILEYVRYDMGLTDDGPAVALTEEGQAARERIVEILKDARSKAVTIRSARSDDWPTKIRSHEPQSTQTRRAVYREPAPLIRPDPDPAPIVPPAPFAPQPNPVVQPMPGVVYYIMAQPQQAQTFSYVMQQPAVVPATAVQLMGTPTVRCGLFGCRLR